MKDPIYHPLHDRSFPPPRGRVRDRAWAWGIGLDRLFFLFVFLVFLSLPLSAQRFFNLAAQPADGLEPVWQNLDLARFREVLPNPLQPVVIQLDAAAPGGYLREWPRPDERADRHRSYALQWFGFAVASLGIWVYFLWRRP